METSTALGSCKRRRPFNASPESSGGEKRNETQSNASGRPSFRSTIRSSSDEDDDDEFLNQISRKTPRRKISRVSIGSDQKKKEKATLSPEAKTVASTKTPGRKSEARRRRRPHITDSDSELESTDECHDTPDDHCKTTPSVHRMSQHQWNDHSNDLTDSSDEESPTTGAIASKWHRSNSSKSSPTEIVPTADNAMTVNARRFTMHKFSKVESQLNVKTTNGPTAKIIHGDETGAMNSDGSVDTVQLTRRLKANLAGKHGDLPTMHSPTFARGSTRCSEVPGDDYSSPTAAPMVPLPTKPKELLTPRPSDDENSMGEQSVDTVQLTRRLRTNLGTKLMDSPPLPVAGKPYTCASHGKDGVNSTDTPTVTFPMTNRERLTDSEKVRLPTSDDEISLGETSVDTDQLTRRLKGNLGMKHNDLPAIPTRACASTMRGMNSLTNADAPLVTLRTKSKGTSSQSEDEKSTGVQSVDTAQLTRRLRANLGVPTGDSPMQVMEREAHDGPHMPREIVANNASWTLADMSTITKGIPPHRDCEQLGEACLEFRLPSPSESSSEDDKVSDDDDEMENDSNKLNHISLPTVMENAHKVPYHSLATIDERHPALPSQSQRNFTVTRSTRNWNQTHRTSDDTLMTTSRWQKSYNRIHRRHEDCQRNEKRCHEMTEMARLPSRNTQIASDAPSNLVHSPDLYETAFGACGSQEASCINVSSTIRPHTSDGKDFHSTNIKAKQISSVQSADEIGDEELFHEAFVGNDACKNPCIMLLDSDSDESRKDHKTRPFHNLQPQPLLVHEGLRTTRQSPRFNIASRVFPKRQGGSTIAFDPPVHEDIADDDDDCSNENNHQIRQRRPRRVTQDHAPFIRHNRSFSMATEERVAVVDNVPATSSIDLTGGDSVGVSGLTRPWRRSSRPRIRDAAASNPLNAASAASTRSLRQRQAPVQGGPDCFGTFAMAQQRQNLQHQRNDIHGGSGAGITGFTFSETRTQLQKAPKDEEDDSITPSGSDKAPSRRPAKRKTRDVRKTRDARRKSEKSGRTLRGRKTAKSSRTRDGWSGRRRWHGNRGVQETVWGDEAGDTWSRSEAFTREDPALRHIGGAEITF